LALGFFKGTISIRDKEGKERYNIVREAPVWSLAWNPSKEQRDVLAVACWDQTISLYQYEPKTLKPLRQRKVDYDPCVVSFFDNGEYLCAGGSDGKATLWTKNGIKLLGMCEEKDWIWSCQQRPGDNVIVSATLERCCCAQNFNNFV